jgi:hypothetical protein
MLVDSLSVAHGEQPQQQYGSFGPTAEEGNPNHQRPTTESEQRPADDEDGVTTSSDVAFATSDDTNARYSLLRCSVVVPSEPGNEVRWVGAQLRLGMKF